LEASVGASNIALAADIAVLEAERNKERKDLKKEADLEFDRVYTQSYTDRAGNTHYYQ
jgi:hypothetical protein